MSQTNKPRFLGYALPRSKNEGPTVSLSFDSFDLDDSPLGVPSSFIDYDGVVIRAGAYECNDPYDDIISINKGDMDRREIELFNAVRNNKPVIFLVGYLQANFHYGDDKSDADLFRRVSARFGIRLSSHEKVNPFVHPEFKEFSKYMSNYGSGYVKYEFDNNDEITYLGTHDDAIYAYEYNRTLFVLPSPQTQTLQHRNAVVEEAIASVLAYRNRMNAELPSWVDEFSFSKELDLRSEADSLRIQLGSLEDRIAAYRSYKGSLSLQHDPLVPVVARIFKDFFAIELTLDDKCVEDASLVENGKTIAVIEIKGVRGNFSREHVNQVDSHRERQSLPNSTPGILIINSKAGAVSVAAKSERPHPDIIKKAQTDNVLMISTLDLLRYADCVERGVIARDSMREYLLTKNGWMTITDDKVVFPSK